MYAKAAVGWIDFKVASWRLGEERMGEGLEGVQGRKRW